MHHTLRIIAVAASMLGLMATGVLAASSSSDEGQASGKAIKETRSTNGMKAGNNSQDRSSMKGDEQHGRANVHVRGDSVSERTKINSETRSARVHRYSSNGPDVSIHTRHHRHYVYNEPDSYLLYKRKHRHQVYSHEEPSVTIRSSHRHVYGSRERAVALMSPVTVVQVPLSILVVKPLLSTALRRA